MVKSAFNYIYRILNVWFLYIAFLIILTVFPHWGNIYFLSWINESIYFLIFLIAITIAIKDIHNRDIFINISIFFFLTSFSFINNFIGDNCLFGNSTVMYHFYVYKKLLINFVLNFMILYTVLKYLFLCIHSQIL